MTSYQCKIQTNNLSCVENSLNSMSTSKIKVRTEEMAILCLQRRDLYLSIVMIHLGVHSHCLWCKLLMNSSMKEWKKDSTLMLIVEMTMEFYLTMHTLKFGSIKVTLLDSNMFTDMLLIKQEKVLNLMQSWVRSKIQILFKDAMNLVPAMKKPYSSWKSSLLLT